MRKRPLVARVRHSTGAARFGVGVLVAVAALAGLGLYAQRDDPPVQTTNLDLFLPAPGSVVEASSVRDEVVTAIRGLLAEPLVHVDGVGYSTGTRSDLSVDIDAASGAVRWRELISTDAAVGEPASDSPMISEYVLIGEDHYLRVLQPGQDPSTPFQVLDASGMSTKLVAGAYTQGGRIFDSLDVLARVLGQVDFSAERLEPREINGTRAQGVRAVFSTEDVMEFLGDAGLEVVAHQEHDEVGHEEEDGAEATTFELWYTGERLVELVATGQQPHDGEAIEDVAVRLTYRTEDPGAITAPPDTVP
jgi:hypothetical protein